MVSATVQPQSMYKREEIEQLRPHFEELFKLLDSDCDGQVDREALAVWACLL